MLLIVENDLAFASFLLDAARAKGFKGLVTFDRARRRWPWPRDYQPAPITLDIYLPDMDGWRVLDRLKSDLATRHLPVCVISTDDSRERAFRSGAMAFLEKPIQSKDEVGRGDGASCTTSCRPPHRSRLLVAMQASDGAGGAGARPSTVPR